jgi:hypothetical protein
MMYHAFTVSCCSSLTHLIPLSVSSPSILITANQWRSGYCGFILKQAVGPRKYLFLFLGWWRILWEHHLRTYSFASSCLVCAYASFISIRIDSIVFTICSSAFINEPIHSFREWYTGMVPIVPISILHIPLVHFQTLFRLPAGSQIRGMSPSQSHTFLGSRIKPVANEIDCVHMFTLR